MIRRRRRQREIPFSFDSFLDVVANVVGIIIRLILVVWVGARSYTTLSHMIAEHCAAQESASTAALPADPLQTDVARQRQELARAQEMLLRQLRELEGTHANRLQLEDEWKSITAGEQDSREREAAIQSRISEQNRQVSATELEVSAIRERQRKLMQDIQALESSPLPKKVLHYRTPVSRPVHSEEFFFECRGGRVSFIDITSFIAEIRQGLEENGKLLRNQWRVTAVTGPLGAFRLRYTLERERGTLDAVPLESLPDPHGPYRYSLTGWVVEPITPARGETLAQALAEKSEFRQIVDRLDPQQVAVTFWVYPDSFALFRELRDYLYRRDLVVAARPLPPDMLITCSRNGSRSQGE